MRAWKTHDLCDLFEATRLGRIPCPYKKFTNHGIAESCQWVEIKKLAAGWPEHMEPDWDMTNPAAYQIEEGIPVPQVLRGRHKTVPAWAVTLEQLKPSQSFVVPAGSASDAQKQGSKMNAYAKKHWPDRFFVTRQGMTNGAVDSLRIWRVE